jgi:hypothetical protein
MDKESFLESVRQLRQKAVEELCRDEELGRYYLAIQKLDEIEAKALAAGVAIRPAEVGSAPQL